jgi:hypothetical protein
VRPNIRVRSEAAPARCTILATINRLVACGWVRLDQGRGFSNCRNSHGTRPQVRGGSASTVLPEFFASAPAGDRGAGGNAHLPTAVARPQHGRECDAAFAQLHPASRFGRSQPAHVVTLPVAGDRIVRCQVRGANRPTSRVAPPQFNAVHRPFPVDTCAFVPDLMVGSRRT